MPHFLLSVLRPTGWSPSDADPEMMPRIDALNDAMVAAGVRVYVGGLADPASAIRCRPEVTPAPPTGEFLNGLWILNVADEATALNWARQASLACGAEIEVRSLL